MLIKTAPNDPWETWAEAGKGHIKTEEGAFPGLSSRRTASRGLEETAHARESTEANR